MVDQAKFTALLQANVEASSKSNSTTVTMVIKGMTPFRPVISKAGQVLPVLMMITEAHGNFWPLASAVKNMPTDFSKTHTATVVLTIRKVNEVDRVNVSSVEFEGLNNETAQMIKQMPAGTALFATAK